MNTNKPVSELIRLRKSWRSYLNEPISSEVTQTIQSAIENVESGPFGNKARFAIIEKQIAKADMKVKLGTYGFIKGANTFLVGAVRREDYHCEDYGYLMEKLILFFTDLGLGTCWLGGTFHREDFARLIDLQADEIIPAISPVGYATSSRSFRDRLIRRTAGSKVRKTWEELFFLNTFHQPLTPDESEEYALPLESLRQAPSASNKQPWRVVKEADKAVFHFYLQKTPGYDTLFKAVDLQRVDMGIGMSHFEMVAKESQLTGSWQILEPLISSQDQHYVASWIGT